MARPFQIHSSQKQLCLQAERSLVLPTGEPEGCKLPPGSHFGFKHDFLQNKSLSVMAL